MLRSLCGEYMADILMGKGLRVLMGVRVIATA